jgi:hypothetical protein
MKATWEFTEEPEWFGGSGTLHRSGRDTLERQP